MTAPTTIDALMFELRDGLGALAEEATRARLASCNKQAMRQVATRLQRGKGGRFDPDWSDEDIQTLILEWHRLKRER